jgi:hypothetical protein
MPPTVMYDATHENVSSLPRNAPMAAGYVTGGPTVKWTDADWARFTTTRKVTIDQAFTGSPVPTATVRDVEPGAWTPEGAVTETANWNAGRPTIYCDRNDLPRVLAAGWKGDLWLAIPSDQPPTVPPSVPGCTVVAVQYGFPGTHDLSVVFDPFWPARKPSMPGITFPPPTALRETASVDLVWDAVAPIDGKAPTSYQVQFLGLDGRIYYEGSFDTPSAHVTGLTAGWTYNVHVWANGGDNAPQHVSIIVHT